MRPDFREERARVDGEGGDHLPEAAGHAHRVVGERDLRPGAQLPGEDRLRRALGPHMPHSGQGPRGDRGAFSRPDAAPKLRPKMHRSCFLNCGSSVSENVS